MATGLEATVPFTLSAALVALVFVGAWALACYDSGGCAIGADRLYGQRQQPPASNSEPASWSSGCERAGEVLGERYEETRPLTRESVTDSVSSSESARE